MKYTINGGGGSSTYLAKVLTKLAKHGLIDSASGVQGG